MNILFLTSAAPRKSGFSTSEKRAPLGLGFLISVLRENGHQVYFSDEYLKPSKILESKFLEENEIDFVGIYSNTICYESTLNMFNILKNKRDKGLWKGKIIVGGPHTSVGKDTIPSYVDYIVIGEGENVILPIINGTELNRIVYGTPVDDLDTLPMPAWDIFINQKYDWGISWMPEINPVITMNTSRGCPYNCTFCSVKAIWGKTYRFMSANNVLDQIEYLIENYGAKAIYFREDHFTLNKKRLEDFCNGLIDRCINIDWYCETRVDVLQDYEIVELMAKSGCKIFYIGVESGSQRMLDFYKKGETVEQFVNTFKFARKVGIKTYASFVVGYPFESDNDIKLTEEFIHQIKPDFIGKNVFLGLPGSELYDDLKNNKMYEYEDRLKILYPIGYKKNAEKYYGFNPYFNFYSLGILDFISTTYKTFKFYYMIKKNALKSKIKRLIKYFWKKFK